MTRRDARAYLSDLSTACRAIAAFVDERGGSDLVRDNLLRAAIERELGIIGEAMWQLDRHFPEVAERFTNSRRIVGLRHILVHGYHTVNPVVLEGVVRDHLPLLEQEVDDALMVLGDEPD